MDSSGRIGLVNGDGTDAVQQFAQALKAGAGAFHLRVDDAAWRWPVGTMEELRNLCEVSDCPRLHLEDLSPPQASAAHAWLRGTSTVVNGDGVGARARGSYRLTAVEKDLQVSLLPEWALHLDGLIHRDWLLGQDFDGFIIDCSGLRTMDSQAFNLFLSWRQALAAEHSLRLVGVNRRCQELIRQMRLDLVFTVEGSEESGWRPPQERPPT